MNPIKYIYMTPQTLKNHSNHFTLPNEMEDLKLSSEMRLKKKRKKKRIPPNYLASKELNEKLPQPHKL